MNYNFMSETKTFIVKVEDLSVVTKNPIIVTNHDTGKSREFVFNRRGEDNSLLFTCNDLNMMIVE